MRVCLSLLILALCALARAEAADFVEPNDRVTNGVVIRAEPRRSSDALGVLRPGEQLPYRGAVPYWRMIELPDGETGFVSKSYTRMIETQPADAATSGFVLDVVDVGTGLATVVKGPDFVLVYDGGSNDDTARGDDNRLLAFLRAKMPDLQRIDHLILSHPHRDHVELLADLFDAYSIGEVWDSGALHDICGYRAFLTRVAVEEGVIYHDALGDRGLHQVSFAGKRCYNVTLPEETIEIEEGARIDNEAIALSSRASMRFLHVDGSHHANPNENSLVMMLALGDRRVLFMGDAEAGGRAPPAGSPSPNSIEGMLIACCADELEADILIVGHHGSMTSSRRALLDKVSAKFFAISSGPFPYNHVVLPDAIVEDELKARGALFETTRRDSICAAAVDKTGPDDDGRFGGCDNIEFKISPNGDISAAYLELAD